MGVPSREKMIEDLIQHDLNSMDLDALINHFTDSCLEYFEDMTTPDIRVIYEEYIDNDKGT